MDFQQGQGGHFEVAKEGPARPPLPMLFLADPPILCPGCRAEFTPVNPHQFAERLLHECRTYRLLVGISDMTSARKPWRIERVAGDIEVGP
jgi:hypothetical protein